MTHLPGHDAELRCADLSFAYPGRPPLLRRVTLRLGRGERLGLVGPNGSGKTTLLLCLAGLLPCRGRRFLDDEELPPGRPDGARVGLLFQHPEDMLFMPTVLEDVAFGPLNLGLPPPEAEAAARRHLARLGIAHLAPAAGLELSVGEQRLAALAAVLALEPPVLLLDEPTANLDAPSRVRLLRLLRELPGSLLMATHDPAAVGEVCTRVVYLADGRLREAPTPAAGPS